MTRPALERIIPKVQIDKNTGCWIFTGATDRDGYGAVNDNGMKLVHRVVWTALRGGIPDGLVIDHLCRERGCCNPSHLEPVTQGENIRRSFAARKGVAA